MGYGSVDCRRIPPVVDYAYPKRVSSGQATRGYLVFPFFFWLFDTNRQHRKLIFLLTVAVWILLCALLGCLAPDVYNNIELAVCRFPAFLFGVYYGGKIYTHEPFRWP